MAASPIEKIKGFFERKLEKALFGDDLGGEIHSGISDNINEFFQLNPLSNMFPYRDFDEENQLYNNATTRGFILEADPLSGAKLEHSKIMYNLLQTTLPEGAMVQGLLVASPKIGKDLDDFVASRDGSGELLLKLAKKRAAHIKMGATRSLLASEDYVVRDYKFYLTVLFENPELDVAKIVAVKNRLNKGLQTIGLDPVEVGPAALLNLLDLLLRPSENLYSSAIKWDPYKPLNQQVNRADSHHKVTSQRVIFNDHWEIRTYHVAKLPTKPMFLSENHVLVGDLFDSVKRIGCPFVLSFIVRITKQSKVHNKIMLRAKLAKNRAREEAKANTAKTRDREEAYHWDKIVELADKKERVIECSYQITLYTRPNQSTAQETNLREIFKPDGLSPWELQTNCCLHFPLFFAHLPLVQSNRMFDQLSSLNRSHMLWTHNAANLFPMLAETKGHSSKRFTISERRGQLFCFDPFCGGTNYNVTIVGDSGSGKSVLVNELVCSILATGGKCFIVDVGKSYRKICLLLSGTFVDVRSDHTLCFNPYTFTNFADPDEVQEFVTYMTTLIASMADPNGGFVTGPVEGMIQAAINMTLNKGNAGELQDIINVLAAHEDQRARDVAWGLQPFRHDGPWGGYFNGQCNVDLQNRLTVFELEGINERLKPVIFQILVYQLTQQMYLGSRKQQIALVVDEAWDVLSGPLGAKTANHMVRRARKYMGALIAASQTLADMGKNEGTRVLLTVSYWLIMLMQNLTSIDEAIDNKYLNLTAFQQKLLKSIKTQKGEYSEVYIRGSKEEVCVGRLLLDPYSLMAYSTDAADYSLVESFIDKTKPQDIAMAEAIEQAVAVKYGKDFVKVDVLKKGQDV